MAIGDFLLNLASGGIVGGFASYVASVYFLKNNNKNHRPVIEISDKLIKTTRPDGTPALSVKIINKTDKDIADVMFEIEGVKNMAPMGSIPLYDLTLLGKRTIMFVKEYEENDTSAHYAHRVNLYQCNGNIIDECSKYQYIRVSLRASCPYYGTSVILSQNYDVENDILNSNYSFNTGNSLSLSAH